MIPTMNNAGNTITQNNDIINIRQKKYIGSGSSPKNLLIYLNFFLFFIIIIKHINNNIEMIKYIAIPPFYLKITYVFFENNYYYFKNLLKYLSANTDPFIFFRPLTTICLTRSVV